MDFRSPNWTKTLQKNEIKTKKAKNLSLILTRFRKELIPIIQHHLETPTGHGTPEDVLIVFVGEVVATQLATELAELLAQGNVM